MTKEPKLHLFEVRGSSYFPMDMLRYDKCWPAKETESPLLRGTDQRAVLMASHKIPTPDRWASFGWEVMWADEWEKMRGIS